MKLSLLSAAPVLLLASSTAFAQTTGAAPAPAPAAAPAPAPAAAAPADVPAAAPVAAAPEAPVAPAPVAPAPPPPPAALPPPAEPPPALADTPLAAKLGISKDGFWQPSALLQFWIFGANQGGDNTTTLRIRRAELRMKGEIIPKFFSYNVMIDPARALDNNSQKLTTSDGMTTVTVNNQGTVTILQDYMVSFMTDYADVTVGQFKIPISYEGYNGSSKLLFPERAVVSRRFGDQRDLGIKIDKKLGKHFYYQAAVFNGEGQNKLDSNAQKDLALRLEVYPIDGVMIGGAGYTGISHRDSSPTKDRLEADLKVDLANFLLQAEYIHGWDGATGQPTPRTESAGYYATIGYTIADKVQPLFRIGRFDSNVRLDLPGDKPGAPAARQGGTTPAAAPFGDELNTYEIGLNYFLKGNDAKLQASWSKYHFANQLDRGELIVSAQAAF